MELLLETDVSNFPELASRPPRPWSFIGTALVAFIAYGVFALTSGLSLGVLLSLQHVPTTISPAERDALVAQGHWYGAAIIASCPFVVGVLWIAIRIRQEPFADYLGLIWPSRAELAYSASWPPFCWRSRLSAPSWGVKDLRLLLTFIELPGPAADF